MSRTEVVGPARGCLLALALCCLAWAGLIGWLLW